jgi:hypothetical protein
MNKKANSLDPDQTAQMFALAIKVYPWRKVLKISLHIFAV